MHDLSSSFLARRTLCALAALVGLSITAGPSAYGQSAGGGPFSMSSGRSGGDGPYRSLMLGLPLASTARGPVGRVELNLYGKGSLAVEGSSEVLAEDLLRSQVAESGESMMTKGGQMSLLYFRYSKPASMAGWYYGMGLGYHEESVQWHRRTSAPGIALADASYVNHSASLRGPTGHGRVGYRYVGTDVPMLVGGYFGLRHFQASISDSKPEDYAESSVAPVAMSEAERTRLLNRFRTAPEIGIEIGFVL